MTPLRPQHEHWLTREAAAFLRYRKSEDAIAFMRRRGLRPIVRGRCLLWHAAAVQRLVEPEAVTPPAEGDDDRARTAP